jgi:hypothetical protein
MEIKDNKITFSISDKEEESFLKSCQIMKEDPEAVFHSFLMKYAFKAERRSHPELRLNSIENRTKRIARWASMNENIYHRIIRAYFLTRDEKTHKAKRSDMEKTFYYGYKEESDHYQFLRNFRLLCTKSDYSFGRVFLYYANSDHVELDEEVALIIEDMKKDFLKSNMDIEVSIDFHKEN